MSIATMSIADGDPGAYDTLILGIGNILWADEGFGIRTIETLHERYTFPDNVRVMDGGTQGIFLLPWVRNAKRLLIFDAVDFGLAPAATLKVIRDDEVPRFMGAKKVSMHQTGFQEVLASADLAGDLPLQMVLIGVQPELLDDYRRLRRQFTTQRQNENRPGDRTWPGNSQRMERQLGASRRLPASRRTHRTHRT
jgi:hydrogenase expression/formation protein